MSRDSAADEGSLRGYERATQPPATQRAPSIRAMSGAECEALLDKHAVGRIAYAFGHRVDIIPIHYVRDGAWLYGRTSPGAKTEAWQRNRWIAFEIDDVRDVFDWSSVVVHGALYVLAPDGSAEGDANFEHALSVLRRLIPATATIEDPVPARTVVFRIHLDEVDGRTTSISR